MLKLEKALYGLRNAPRAWNKKWNKTVASCGFKQLQSDECVYTRGNGQKMIWVLMYGDDVLVMGNSAADILKANADLKNMFAMTDMGTLKYFLGDC